MAIRTSRLIQVVAVSFITCIGVLSATDASADLYVSPYLIIMQVDSQNGGIELVSGADASSSYPNVSVYNQMRTPSESYMCSNSNYGDQGWASSDCSQWVYYNTVQDGEYSTLGQGGDQHEFVGCILDHLGLAYIASTLVRTTTSCGSSGDFVWSPVCSNPCSGGSVCSVDTPGFVYKNRYGLMAYTGWWWCAVNTPYYPASVSHCIPF